MGRTRDKREPCAEETIRMHSSHEVTLLDVIRAVSAVAVNDEETIATRGPSAQQRPGTAERRGHHGHDGRVGDGGRGGVRP